MVFTLSWLLFTVVPPNFLGLVSLKRETLYFPFPSTAGHVLPHSHTSETWRQTGRNEGAGLSLSLSLSFWPTRFHLTSSTDKKKSASFFNPSCSMFLFAPHFFRWHFLPNKSRSLHPRIPRSLLHFAFSECFFCPFSHLSLFLVRVFLLALVVAAAATVLAAALASTADLN